MVDKEVNDLFNFLKKSYSICQYRNIEQDLTFYNWSMICSGIIVNVSYVYDHNNSVYRQQFGTDRDFIRIQWTSDINNIKVLEASKCITFLLEMRFCKLEFLRDYKLNKILEK